MMSLKSALFLLLLSLLACENEGFSQTCTTLGQTPSTAFPVCGTTTFHQTTVPLCSTNSLFVPGCSGNGNALYENKNPFWYKFTCYVSGTLGFLISPIADNEDYDWQLFDITGHNPDDIFTDHSLVVTGNWAGTYGATGASATGVNTIQCASDPNDHLPSFAKMPNIIAGHEYLLLVSHFTPGQSGYDLSFGGGTAVITDPTAPHMKDVKTNCGGTSITLKLNKNVACSSLTPTGSEFSISPAVTTVTGVTTDCSTAFDFNEITITLASALPTGNYQLVIDNGTDGTTLRDNCGTSIPRQEQVPFQYSVPQPILADSISRIGCAPDLVKLYYPKNITCNSVAPSDFIITGPTPVTISSAVVDCTTPSSVIMVKFAAPIYTKGTYQLSLKPGLDGNTAIDECGVEVQRQTFDFTTSDTVSASYGYTADLGCRNDTLHFLHDGAHDVNTWHWVFNDSIISNAQGHTIVFPASSTNTVQLIVSNGVCGDTLSNVIVLDNEVKAGFNMPPVICPEDPLTVTDSSSGLIDNWYWNFSIAGSSTLENPAPVHFPTNNIETLYTIKQVVVNNTLHCTDSVQKVVKVLNNCFIAVPTGFTPNGDGRNDYLYPNNAIKAENLRFRVYNRWGQLVFKSNNWQDKWDGNINGIPQATGVYVWMLEYTHTDTKQKIFQKGTTTLIR